MFEVDLEAEPVKRSDFSQEPEVPRKTVLVTLPSGEIRTEAGADGLYLLFDCDCMDALPWCKAQCCTLQGLVLQPEEAATNIFDEMVWNEDSQVMEIKKDADGRCAYNDRRTCKCTIYENRPHTCQSFHCTRGANMRGYKIPSYVVRQTSR